MCLQSYCLDVTEETEDEQLFETWLLLEYCDKGSLQDAVDRGWFHADQNGHIDSRTKPNMRAIRSAGMACMHSLQAGHCIACKACVMCVLAACLKACQATVACCVNQTVQSLSGNCCAANKSAVACQSKQLVQAFLCLALDTVVCFSVPKFWQ